jgi:hypothetical protein
LSSVQLADEIDCGLPTQPLARRFIRAVKTLLAERVSCQN